MQATSQNLTDGHRICFRRSPHYKEYMALPVTVRVNIREAILNDPLWQRDGKPATSMTFARWLKVGATPAFDARLRKELDKYPTEVPTPQAA
jgi:hypothetical protein